MEDDPMRRTVSALLALGLAACGTSAPSTAGDGWVSLFNGKDLAGWKIPEGDNGHWKVLDGVIDYDARSEAPKNQDLWTAKAFGDFVLTLDWRTKAPRGPRWAPE